MDRVCARGASVGAAVLLLASCAYDLSPYQVDASTSSSSGTTSSSAVGGGGAAGNTTATSSSSKSASSTSTGTMEASSSSGVVETPYPFCSDPDPLDDAANWNDGNQVTFDGGQVQIGPDNGLSFLTWHDDLNIAAPCVFTTRLLKNQGFATFGLRKNSGNLFFMSATDKFIHGPNPASDAVAGSFPMTLAIIVSGGAVITAFHDASGWHRLDSIGAPSWITDGLRPVMAKSGDDLYAVFDAFNADPVYPSDIGEPPL